MVDTTKHSDEILTAAGRSLQVQREGGTHRPGPSIGQGSAKLKWQNRLKKIRNVALAVGAVWIGASIIGLVIEGLGFTGLMAAGALTLGAMYVFGKYPKMKIPQRADLKKGDARAMVGRTELWLEHQRPALPPPAMQVVDQLGVQLDALGAQLETIDQAHPAVNEVRELVGEYIPETIENYRKIPQHLRNEEHAGKTADDRLTESLTKISGEVDRVTRRMAEGALDDLAIKARYLDYRFGGAEALEDQR
ncbi:MAG TPA: hypothetical protein DCS24_03665 [Erythrobacter sp.]|nr:hypothetical protein [Erythrobacter sp.]